MILTLQKEFKKIHKDSQYIYPTKKGPIGTTLIFDTRINSDKVLTLDISILNTRSPKHSIKLIKDIEEHFTDRIILADDFMIKFDRYTPITAQVRIKNIDFEHIEITMDAKLFKNNTNGPDNIQISRA